MLVRSGESRLLGTSPALLKREGGNTAEIVYTEMLLQITRDYPGLPDARTLTFREITFFYAGLRSELIRATTPK